MNLPPRNIWRDAAVGITMFVFALFAVLSALSDHLPLIVAILYVLAIGTLPWPIYNIIAHFAGWKKSSGAGLARYWLDLIFWTLP